MKTQALILLIFISFSTFIGTQKVDAEGEIKLAIATRLDLNTYTKFAEAFANSEYGNRVGITDKSEIKFIAPTTFEGFLNVMTYPIIQVSLGWGGGTILFNNLWEEGAIKAITNQTLINYINTALPDTIAGEAMKNYENISSMIWAANSISSFGFLVNHNELEKRGLSVPETWDDLASADFYTPSEYNIGMGKASDSIISTRIYQIIVQKYGWENGWEILNSMAGNAKIYNGSRSIDREILTSVINDEIAVGLSSVSYAIEAMRQNPNYEYIIPINGTILDAEPIAFSKNPPHIDAANAFIEFTLSQEGQAIWLDTEINKLPIRYDAFDTIRAQNRSDIDNIEEIYNKTLANIFSLFDRDLAFSVERVLRGHFEGTITNVHTELRSVWGDLVTAYESKEITLDRFILLKNVFGKPLISLQDAMDYVNYDPIGWSLLAIEKFDSVKQMLTEQPSSSITEISSSIITEISSSSITEISSSSITEISSSIDRETTVFDAAFNAYNAIFLSFAIAVIIRRKRK